MKEKEEDKKRRFVIPYDEAFEVNESLLTLIPEWLRNFVVNCEAVFKMTIHDLPKIEGSALIVDHPFTGSFERQAEYLKDYKGVVLCCDRALSRIIECGRIPEYVVNVDSSWLCTSFFDRPEVRECMDKITAIFAVTTFPLTIRTWTGKKIFFTPYIGGCEELTVSISAKSKTDIIRCGWCVHNTSWAIAYALGAKIIGLYGIDNSYDSVSQCEHTGTNINIKSYYVKELDRTFFTDSIYKFYAEILFDWMRYTKGDVEVVNATENGIMYDSVAKLMEFERGKTLSDSLSIKRMSLKEFVEKNDNIH